MPRADDDQEAIAPRNHTVRISGMLHVGSRHKLPPCLVEDTRRLQVGLSASDSTTSHVYPSLHLDTLLIP